MARAKSCPVSGVKADETVVRLVAAQVALLVVIAVLGQSAILSAVIAADFGLKAFGLAKFSLLKTVAKAIKSSLSLKSRMTDEAPKIFAVRTGLVMMLLLTASQLSGFTFTALSIGGLIVTFAALESVLGVCVGCLLYNEIYKFKQI